MKIAEHQTFIHECYIGTDIVHKHQIYIYNCSLAYWLIIGNISSISDRQRKDVLVFSKGPVLIVFHMFLKNYIE